MSKFKLPNGIQEGEKLFNVVNIDEMTGKQQNYLVNSKYKSPIDHLEPLLTDLIVSVETEDGEEMNINKKRLVKFKLSLDDIQFIAVKIREITFGEEFIFEKKECPHCNHKQDSVIDLSKLEIIQPEVKKDSVIKLPKSKQEFEYKQITLGQLAMYSSDSDRMINSVATSTVSMVAKRIGDIEDITEELIENLKALDIQTIQKKAPEYPHIDLSITHECGECGKDFDFDIETMDPSFFTLG